MGRQQAQHQSGVDKYVAFRMETFWLLAPFERRDLRKDHPHEPTFIKQIKPAKTVRVHQDLEQFIPDAFRTNDRDRMGLVPECRPGTGLYLERKRRREPNRAKHPQTILRKAFRREADCPDYLAGK